MKSSTFPSYPRTRIQSLQNCQAPPLVVLYLWSLCWKSSEAQGNSGNPSLSSRQMSYLLTKPSISQRLRMKTESSPSYMTGSSLTIRHGRPSMHEDHRTGVFHNKLLVNASGRHRTSTTCCDLGPYGVSWWNSLCCISDFRSVSEVLEADMSVKFVF